MTQKRIAAVRDVKLGEYLGLAVVKNDVEAQRHYVAMLNHPQSAIAKHPRDYQVHDLGAVDMETGILEPGRVPRDITPYGEIEEFLRLKEIAK